MFGLSFGLKGMAIALAIGLVVGAVGGWRVRDDACDAAAARAEVARLRADLAARDRAATNLATRTINDAVELGRLQTRVTDLETRISDGDCFTDADARGVSDLWSAQPAAGAR